MEYLDEQLSLDIQYLLDKYAVRSFRNHDHLKEFILSAVYYYREDPDPEDILPLKEGLDEILAALKMFKKHKYEFKISVFGSARIPESDPLYQETLRFTAMAAQRNMKIITGAGPGIMEAGNKGAGPENSFGLGIHLPYESNNVIFRDYPQHLILFNNFYSRKHIFYHEAQAIVVFPGGFGTMDEIFQGLTSMQTGKMDLRPFILCAAPGESFWADFDVWLRQNLMKKGYISPEDPVLYDLAYTAEDVLTLIDTFYRLFFSYWILEDKLFLQLKVSLPEEQLSAIRDLLPGLDMKDLMFIRDRYFNDQTLFVYRLTLTDNRNPTQIKKLIQAINQLPL